MNIGLIYFSPTGNTAKIVDTVKKKLVRLNNEVNEFDITNYPERQKLIELNKFDAFLFGFPIYYWRAPRTIREWLTTLDGGGRKCSVFFTYGGIHVGIARQDIKEILEKQNFILVSIAKFVASHSFNISGWKANLNRPNETDLMVAEEFAAKTYEIFTKNKHESIVLKPPKRAAEEVDRIETTSKRSIPTPMREIENCSMCRTCEQICPTNSMNADRGKPNRKTCIRCFRCVINCPDNVLKARDMSAHYKLLKERTQLTDEMINSKKSKYYV
ncbi:MAG: EFR1 family ferrodoxin [Candidatus Hermodarchaeota archaeon]